MNKCEANKIPKECHKKIMSLVNDERDAQAAFRQATKMLRSSHDELWQEIKKNITRSRFY